MCNYIVSPIPNNPNNPNKVARAGIGSHLFLCCALSVFWQVALCELNHAPHARVFFKLDPCLFLSASAHVLGPSLAGAMAWMWYLDYACT